MAGIIKDKTKIRDVAHSVLFVALALVSFIMILWVVTSFVTIILTARF